jgi:hypothetical protein
VVCSCARRQISERIVGEPIDGPLIHRRRAERFIEIDRRLIFGDPLDAGSFNAFLRQTIGPEHDGSTVRFTRYVTLSDPPGKLLTVALSAEGYRKVQEIMEGDEVIKTNERNNPIFGKDLFYLSILGTPSPKTPWTRSRSQTSTTCSGTAAGRLSRLPLLRSSRTATVCWRARSASTTWLPIKPAPPVTRIRILSLP